MGTETIDLPALAAQEREATPGPWSGYRTGVLHDSTWVIGNAPDDSGAIMSLANASLIAALRNHAPALIAAAQERDALLRHLGPGAAAEHNVLALLDLYEARATKAEAERDAARRERDAAHEQMIESNRDCEVAEEETDNAGIVIGRVTAERDAARLEQRQNALYAAKQVDEAWAEAKSLRLTLAHLETTGGREQCARVERERDAARALLVRCVPAVEIAAEPDISYGMGGAVSNPHGFDPDPDCSTDKERAAHEAACEAWDRGERPGNDGRGCSAEGNMIVCRAPWGLGTYQLHDEEAETLLRDVRAAIGEG